MHTSGVGQLVADPAWPPWELHSALLVFQSFADSPRPVLTAMTMTEHKSRGPH